MLKKILAGLVLLVLFFVSSRVLFFQPLFRVHDFVHGARIAEMAKNLSEGGLPVRWSSNFGYGYGMPLFEFYAPLPYFVSSLFFLLGFSLSFSVKSLFLIAALLTILGAYLLGKEKFGLAGGLILATLYTLAPYRAVNLFVRGALSEIWGMAFLPWILWGSWLIWRRQPLGLPVVTLAVCFVLLSHNLTALIALPTLLFLILVWWLIEAKVSISLFWTKNFQKITKLLLSFGLGFGLSAFYFLPALVEKDFTQLNSLIQSNYFDFHNHFLYLRQFLKENWGYGGSAWGPDDGFSFFLGWPAFLVLALFGFWLLKKAFLAAKKNQLKIIFSELKLPLLLVSLIAISILLTTQKTLFLWENLPLLSYLQFPWRFLSLISFLLSLLAAWFTTRLNRFAKLLLLFSVLSLASFFGWRYFQPENYLDNEQALFYADPAKIRSDMSSILPDYLPTDLKVAALPTPFQSLIGLSDQEHTNSQIIIDRSQEKLYQFSLDSSRVVELAVAAYPGWQVEVDGQLQTHSISDRGLLAVELPKGKHLVAIVFKETPFRFFADIVSVVSLLILIGGGANICRTKSDN